jgi:hypothetical protein
VYGEREITIWESYEFDFPDQWKSDMEIRSKIINECLDFSGKFEYRHMDGSKFSPGSELPHRSRILIVPIPDTENVQPECLASARLDQPAATAQVCDISVVSPELDISRGKSASCTVSENLKAEVELLRNQSRDTLPAIISFGKHSVQMFFFPEQALDDFRRKVKELWNIPPKMYYLLINGKHESWSAQDWPAQSLVHVCLRGLLGGMKPRIKVHLKVDDLPKIYAFEIRDDALLGDLNEMIADIFGNVARAGLYQNNALLDIADNLRDWLSNTGGKSEIALKETINFAGDEIIEEIPVMEVIYDDESHWVRDTPDWKKIIEEKFNLCSDPWKLNKASQDWEEGTFQLIPECDDESSESSEDLPSTSESSLPPFPKFIVDFDKEGVPIPRIEIEGKPLAQNMEVSDEVELLEDEPGALMSDPTPVTGEFPSVQQTRGKTEKYRQREAQQAEFKREAQQQEVFESLRKTTVIVKEIIAADHEPQFKDVKYSKDFYDTPAYLRLRHFHRWIQKITGLPKDLQNFTKFDDAEAVAFCRVSERGSPEYREILGKTFRFCFPKLRKAKIVHWRLKHVRLTTIPLAGNHSRPLRRHDISKHGLYYLRLKETGKPHQCRFRC